MTKKNTTENSLPPAENERTNPDCIRAGNLLEREKEFHNSMKPASCTNYNNGWSDSHPNHYKAKMLNITDSFLNNCRHDKTELMVDLCDGSKEKGIIVAFDNAAIIMSNSAAAQYLVMKAAIVKIVPSKCVNYIFNDIHASGPRESKNWYDCTGQPGLPF